MNLVHHGPLARYVTMRVAHAPGLPGTFSPPPRVSDADMHHGTCGTHMLWCMLGSLTSSFRWSRCRGKCSRHSRLKRKPQIYVSGKRPIGECKLKINPALSTECKQLCFYALQNACPNGENVMGWTPYPSRWSSIIRESQSWKILSNPDFGLAPFTNSRDIFQYDPSSQPTLQSHYALIFMSNMNEFSKGKKHCIFIPADPPTKIFVGNNNVIQVCNTFSHHTGGFLLFLQILGKGKKLCQKRSRPDFGRTG